MLSPCSRGDINYVERVAGARSMIPFHGGVRTLRRDKASPECIFQCSGDRASGPNAPRGMKYALEQGPQARDSGFGARCRFPSRAVGKPRFSAARPLLARDCSSGAGDGLAGRPVLPHRHTPPSPTRWDGSSGDLGLTYAGGIPQCALRCRPWRYRQPVMVDPHLTYEKRSQAQQGCSFLQTQVLTSPVGKR